MDSIKAIWPMEFDLCFLDLQHFHDGQRAAAR